MTLVGDDALVAGRLGPEGGSLALAADGIRLEIPSGVIDAEGKVVSLRVETFGDPPALPGAEPVGPRVTISPPIVPPEGKTFRVSVPIASLPVPADADLRLAVEKATDVGPGDGSGTPTTSWDLVPTERSGDRAVATLFRVHGMRLQFVRLATTPPAPGGSP